MRQFYGHLEKCVLSAGKTMSVKLPFFGGGGLGSADFIFMGARIFLKSRSKFLISIEIFNLARKFQSRRLEFPTKNRAAGGGSLENFILARNLEFF